MKAIILAAGRGSRMGDLTVDRPKCMVPLAGRPLVAWQLGALRGAGVQEIAVVRGYQGHRIEAEGVVFIDNPRWERTNMVGSLVCAGDWMAEGDTVVSYSDIVYPAETVRRLAGLEADVGLTYDILWHELWSRRFADPLSDAETFRVATDGRILEIGRRPGSLADVEGQYMGLLKFSARGWRIIREHLAGRDDVDLLDMTSLLGQLVAAGHLIHGVAVAGSWGEVDSTSDLALYETMIADGGLVLET